LPTPTDDKIAIVLNRP